MKPVHLFTTDITNSNFELRTTLNAFEPSRLGFSNRTTGEIDMVDLSNEQAEELLHLNGRFLAAAYSILRAARPDFRPPGSIE